MGGLLTLYAARYFPHMGEMGGYIDLILRRRLNAAPESHMKSWQNCRSPYGSIFP